MMALVHADFNAPAVGIVHQFLVFIQGLLISGQHLLFITAAVGVVGVDDHIKATLNRHINFFLREVIGAVIGQRVVCDPGEHLPVVSLFLQGPLLQPVGAVDQLIGIEGNESIRRSLAGIGGNLVGRAQIVADMTAVAAQRLEGAAVWLFLAEAFFLRMVGTGGLGGKVGLNQHQFFHIVIAVGAENLRRQTADHYHGVLRVDDFHPLFHHGAVIVHLIDNFHLQALIVRRKARGCHEVKLRVHALRRPILRRRVAVAVCIFLPLELYIVRRDGTDLIAVKGKGILCGVLTADKVITRGIVNDFLAIIDLFIGLVIEAQNHFRRIGSVYQFLANVGVCIAFGVETSAALLRNGKGSADRTVGERHLPLSFGFHNRHRICVLQPMPFALNCFHQAFHGIAGLIQIFRSRREGRGEHTEQHNHCQQKRHYFFHVCNHSFPLNFKAPK